ncbi:hypothetical protein NP493_8451g00001 [Ridgeia piscesae]|uniref:Uncharacterized protein n=1 Tax=Ridgeia piscesae TaxID=27915 RepID=A0AAD9IP91_RIDPI|nr:hypothetical protein NP493_8451g00001 [Ridgeia piscesae]
MLHKRMQKDSEVQPPLSVVNRTVNLAVTSAAQSAEGQMPAASRNTTVMTSPVTSMGSAKWTDSHVQPTASFGIGPALQLRGPQVVFPPGMSTEARIEHLLRNASMSLAASADVAPPPYSVATSKTPGFTTSAAVTSLEQAFGNNNPTMFPSGAAQTFSHSLQQQQQHISGIPMSSNAVASTLSVSAAYATAMQKMQAVNMSVPQGVYTVCLPGVVSPAVDMSHSLPRTASEFLSSLANMTSSVESSTSQSAVGRLPVTVTQAALNCVANAIETSATLVTVNQATMSPCVNSTVISNTQPDAAENYSVASAGPTAPTSVGIVSQLPRGLSARALPPTCGCDLMNGTITAASITAVGISVPPLTSIESHAATPVLARSESLSSAGTTIKTVTVASSTVTHPTDSGNNRNYDAVNLSAVDSTTLSSQKTCIAVAMASTNMSLVSTVTAPGLRLPASHLHPELTTTVTSVLSSRVTDNVQQHHNTNATTRSLEDNLLHRQVSSSQSKSALTVHSAIPHTSSGNQSHTETVKSLEDNMQRERDGRSVTQSVDASGSSALKSEHSSADQTRHLAPCVSVYTANSQLEQQSAVTVLHQNHDSDLSSQSACDFDSGTSTQQDAVENHHQSPTTEDSEATIKHHADKETTKATLVKTGDNVITVGFAISKGQSVVDLSSSVLSEKLSLCAKDGDVPCLSKPSQPLNRQQEQGVCVPKTCVMDKLLLKNPDVRMTVLNSNDGADQAVSAVYSSVKSCVSCVQSGRSEPRAVLPGGCRTQEGHSSLAVNGNEISVSVERGETTYALDQGRAYVKWKDGTCFGASTVAGVGCIDGTVACSPAMSHCAAKEVSSLSNVSSQGAGMSHSAHSGNLYVYIRI